MHLLGRPARILRRGSDLGGSSGHFDIVGRFQRIYGFIMSFADISLPGSGSDYDVTPTLSQGVIVRYINTRVGAYTQNVSRPPAG